jgi:hypothetical protein
MRTVSFFALLLIALPINAQTPPQVERPQTVDPGAIPQNIPASNRDPAWRPSAAQQQAVLAVTNAYFKARDAGDAELAYKSLSARHKQMMPLEVYVGFITQFNEKAGALKGRSLKAVTWYKDTPQAGPGLYVAVDFSGCFEKLTLPRGYLIWHEQDDGSFLQVREAQTVIDNETMQRLHPLDKERVRAQAGC